MCRNFRVNFDFCAVNVLLILPFGQELCTKKKDIHAIAIGLLPLSCFDVYL